VTVISVVEHQRITEIKEVKSQFELRPERGYIWVQRFCVWLLAKIGAFANVPSTRIERHDVGKEGDRFMAAVFKARNAVLGSFEMNPTELLIGPKEYAELMDEVISTARFSFDARYFRHIDGETKVYGLKVRMIPWMAGMLLL